MDISLPPYTVNQIGEFAALSQNVPWGLTKLDVPHAWTTTKGEGITVMVFDTGFSGHEDNCNEIKGPSFVVNEPDSRDYNGHGSHVAGIIGACDNVNGVVGVAPRAKIISVKVLDKNGQATSQAILNALKYAAANKPDVVNMSLGSPNAMSSDLLYYMQQLANSGVPIIVAAGNNGATGGILFPAKYDCTFAIGAYDIFNKVADFSAVGPEIDFVAPGVEILSTFLNGQYAIMSGTSMAAPFVTGVVALMLSHAKAIGTKYATAKQIYDVLLKKTADLGPVGFDNQYGFGAIVPTQVVTLSSNTAILPKVSTKTRFWTTVKSWFGWA